MSTPREILKSTTYLLTRRCSQRQFLLIPSEILNQIFLYCAAIAAARTGMEVHALCVLSDHYHIVATDVRGELPEFMRWLNEFVAKLLNAHYGRWESLWAPDSYSAVRLVERNDILAKIVYTLNNPVAAGLVRWGDAWPGLRSRPEDMNGTTWTVERPNLFFRKNGSTPENATLTFTPPPHLKDDNAFVSDVAAFLDFAETSEQENLARDGRRFLGRKAVLKQRHTATAKTREPRRRLNPRIACRDKWRRIEAIQRLRSFYKAYRSAWLQFKEGVRDVLFPPGTYWMTRYAGAHCAEPA